MLSTQHEILEVLSLVDDQTVLITVSEHRVRSVNSELTLQNAQAMVKGRYSRIGPTNDTELTLFVHICGELNMLYIFRNGIWHSYPRRIFF